MQKLVLEGGYCEEFISEKTEYYKQRRPHCIFFLTLPLTDTKCGVATYLSSPGAWENMKGGMEIAYSGQSVLVELN